MIINTSKANMVQMRNSQSLRKEEAIAEQKDGFQQSNAPQESTGYGKNLLKSTIAGTLKGVFTVGEFVSHKLPSYDGLDHTGMHVLMAGISIGCGVCFGAIPGAIYGFTKGLFGGSVEFET